MSSPAAAARRRAPAARPPGLYFDFHSEFERDTAELASGVPAFVGFRRPAAARPAGAEIAEFDHWLPRSWAGEGALVEPAAGSFLAAAVRGFFANGGRHCLVVTVAWPLEHEGLGGERAAQALARALTAVFEPGGPLDERADVDLICVPDASHRGLSVEAARGAFYDVQRAAVAHCERMHDRFALLDAWMGGTANEDELTRLCLYASTDLRSAHAALYAPWIQCDPTRDLGHRPAAGAEQWRAGAGSGAGPDAGAAAPRHVPPCGHIAGTIARIDRESGAHRAPANVILDDALDTACPLSAEQRGRLNDAGVNGLHAVRGAGVRVGGARTRSGQPTWLYISTVRVVQGFRRWLALRMGDLVFEPQSPALWEAIRTRLVLRCLQLQRAGALAGGDPDSAFFVKCDAETNPPAERDLGRVVAHVGLAPSVPAEFIVIRVVQEASGFTVGGLS